ncbi:ABC transporter substrate-binding protein [Variovorax sp. J22G73]|uniref:ABC transporter substrate-binding protein n=1 Tax=unclassified Variovorax TaxID=663243 RepID=UPI0025788168|nr:MULTISPECIES: ABC transporter substrate-binding protein [unclassified Variovorax]MDM0008126.1 ABC transporter substrate-binding protein [Variovorax sp. J22R203]MDM0100632.1 ABC transporter substrate-binding protein [Variovorax sp. J22G73]
MDRRSFIQQSTAFVSVGATGAIATTGLGLPLSAFAQSRKETVRVLAEGAPNSQDPHGEGVSRESLGLFTNVYDRLINFDRVQVSPGVFKYDYGRFRGELAESFEQSADGRTLTFKLRRDATFHDGKPVTANDVKWSLDRAVSLPASKRQLATGSLENPAQFSVVDAHTFRITLPRADRYTLPNLALFFASVLNAELARSHATAADPWAAEWVKANAAGGGAYRVENFTPGQQVIYARFDGWKSGALPQVRRAVFQVVPSASNRVAALLKGDADVALQLPPKDLDALTDTTRAKVVSVPVTTSFRFVAFNTQAKPFDDVRVRQAIAYALPYTSLLRGANLGRGEPLYGAKSAKPTSSRFPQPYPYETQLLRARELLAQAGLAKGFKTSFSYNVGDATLAEPAALLIQEALGKIGIELSIEKVPGAQWGTLQTEKKLPFFIDSSSAWFNDPDYFFRIFFQGDWRWNFGSFKNDELAKLVEQARWETDRARYDRAIQRAIEIAFDQVPLVPLWLPSFEAALQPDLQGFTYYIHGQVDFRPLTRG